MSMGAVEENALFLWDTAKAKRQFGGNTNLTVSIDVFSLFNGKCRLSTF